MSVEEAVKQVKLPWTRLLKTKLEKNALIIFDSKRCVTPFTGRSFCKDSIMTRKEGDRATWKMGHSFPYCCVRKPRYLCDRNRK